MGCTSVAIQQRRILPLPPETVNSYIDKFPAIILQKIKEKFESYANKETRELDAFNFMKLYAISNLSQQAIKRLFDFFNDSRKDNLKFRRFMMKYAIITKCQSQLLYKIFFEIYKSNPEHDQLTRQQFNHFVQVNQQFIETTPFFSELAISKDKFVNLMENSQFNSQQFQKKLVVTTEDDIPFQTINQQIHECDFNDLIEGRQYYLLSNAWFNRWSFYYQEASHTFDKTHIKSTKLLRPLNGSVIKKKKKKSINEQRSRTDSTSFLRTSQMNNSLIEQPNTIDFEQIEGQYKGELKDKLKISAQIRIISQTLWKLLCSLHPPQQQFKRKAIAEDTIQYYPKNVFYIEADSKGQYNIESQCIKHLSVSKPIKSILSLDRLKNKGCQYGIFTKNFFEKNWRQVESDTIGPDISLDPRFFICLAENREKFMQKHFRKDITTKNLDLGDRVYAVFPYIKDSAEAVIIQLSNIKYKVHFKGYSYRYQIDFKAEQLVVEENDEILTSLKKNKQYVVKGISNIGNTCFMNSIIQCLVATPVLDNFLKDYPFDEKKQPVGYGLSILAKSLLANEKPSAYSFKKIIDVHMPLFSGYDQHDAQQFLNLLLDTVAQQLKEKPTVIDYLFGGKAVSRLTCISCKKKKDVEEKMYILSLPIPEAEFNYFSVIMVPVTSTSIKKIIFKIHHSGTVADYIQAFEERTGQNASDFNFCETNGNTLKKIKSQLVTPSFQSKKVIDIGVVPNISLMAYEKIPSRIYKDLLRQKPKQQYRDFRTPSQQYILKKNSQTYWTICKTTTKQSDKKDSQMKVSVQYLNQDDEKQVCKVDLQYLQKNTVNIGSQTADPVYKKLMLRKYNSSLKRFEFFGLQFLLGIPKWASYNQVISIVEKYISNIKSRSAKRWNGDQKGDYIIKFLDPSKVRCIFCLRQNASYNVNESDIGECCSAFDKDIPLGWAARYRKYWIYVDWINFNACNASFCSFIELDPISRNVELSKQNQYINLQDCIKLHNKQEKVQMECDACKFKEQQLQHLIGGMPNILVVHMKEFRYTSQGHLIKLDLRLKWQEYLDSSKFALTVQGKLYELFALVKHSGNSQSGHYTCIAKRKHPFENKRVWVNFDDDVTAIEQQSQNVIDDAYLLFYKKVDMPTSSLVIYSDLKEK